jgi:hypothetical protein
MKIFSYNITGLSPVLKILTLPRKVWRKQKQERNRSSPGLCKDKKSYKQQQKTKKATTINKN